MFPNHEPSLGIYQNEMNMRSFHGKKCIETKIGSISTHLDEVSLLNLGDDLNCWI